MGAGSSDTRKITVEQDAETGVVKISEDVLKRMIGAETPKKVPEPEPEPEPEDHEDIFPLKPEPYKKPEVTEEVWLERIRQVEDDWRERLEIAEKKNDILHELTQEQFHKDTEEVEQKYMQYRINPICRNLQNDILRCYADNPGRTLNCSQQVRDFNQCVDQARTSILSKRFLQESQ